MLKKKQPWLTFDAINYLDCISLKGRRVFEYGSGGSTLYWLKKGAKCISIEHDRAWYMEVKTFIPPLSIIEYLLVPPEKTYSNINNTDPSDPDAYISSLDVFTSLTFQQYASQIDAYPDKHFDVVLIDGRARPSCIKHSARKVNINGMLILDNSDREYYLSQTGIFLGCFHRKEFYGAGPTSDSYWKTDIFIRFK